MRQSKVAAIAVATLALLQGSARAAGPLLSLETTDGVRLRGAWFEEPVRRAVLGAARRLSEPSCAAVLGDFSDASGHRLGERLSALALDAPSYARLVLFYDGSSGAACLRPRVYAFTAPGSRVVRACPTLGRLMASDPRLAEAVVIHELLHTLGLPENPPLSEDITAAVERRCRR